MTYNSINSSINMQQQQSTNIQTLFEQHIDAQSKAANPQNSVWVSANAGSGKTRVLIDRIIRLMLPPYHTPPHKIVCLTFTKTAASEMLERLYKRLGEWIVLDDVALAKNMKELIGRNPNAEELIEGRRLFAKALETPGGLKIQTIHGFCERILKRFPLEANLSPAFEVIDERTEQELLKENLEQILNFKNEALQEVIEIISSYVNENQLIELLQSISVSFKKWQNYILSHNIIDWQYALCDFLNIDIEDNEDLIKTNYLAKVNANKGFFEAVMSALKTGGAKDNELSIHIQKFLNSIDHFDDWELLETIFLTQKGEPRKTLATKKLLEAYSTLFEQFEQEQSYFYEQHLKIKKVRLYKNSAALISLAWIVFENMNIHMKDQAQINYDGLIEKTKSLLESDLSAWVMYKLDGGIDHILVDEAQDTSPEQWQIIKALTEEFFAGIGTNDEMKHRTIFVVGDEKQSIYSFQGADPHAMQKSSDYFQQCVVQAQGGFEIVPLHGSFRSSATILNLVDEVFKHEIASKGVKFYNDIEVQHHAIHHKGAGKIILWDLLEDDSKDDEEPWYLPLDHVSKSSAITKIAQKITTEIARLVKSKTILESNNKPVDYGDILILLKKRGTMMREIAKRLKQANIPIAGTDRMTLTEEIAVMDILALIDFCLLPTDDLTLAVILKSPFCGLNDDDLLSIAYNREGSLWREVQKKFSQSDNRLYKAAYDFLIQARNASNYMMPYDFIIYVLDTLQGRKKLLSRLGTDVEDPIDELLQQALNHAQNNIPSLQDFVQWLRSDTTDVKRELDKSSGEVRLMTVHGAKGMEAGVVFLPDCTSDVSRARSESIYVKDEYFFWSVDDSSLDLIQDLKDSRKIKDNEEYRRLLYVALTRAKDILYIGGKKAKNKSKNETEKTDKKDPEHWYFFIKTALENLGAKEFPDQNDAKKLVYGTLENSTENSEKIQIVVSNIKEQTILPEWLKQSAPNEPKLMKPITPSKLEEDSKKILPVKNAKLYQKGNIIHQLLQLLPSIEKRKWQNAAEIFVAKPAFSLEEGIQKQIVEQTLNVLNHPILASVFGKGSYAEVPITGIIDEETGRVISGQIDRLIILEDKILVVDFKTNKVPPASKDKIPLAYIKQLEFYKQALAKIYPNKKIEYGLLWTENAHLMML